MTTYRVNQYANPSDFRYPKLLHLKYDNFFKALVARDLVADATGNVESPSGYVALVNIPKDIYQFSEIVELISDLGGLDELFDEDGHPSKFPAAGWYVTLENSMGMIFVHEFQREADARAAYIADHETYLKWVEEG